MDEFLNFNSRLRERIMLLIGLYYPTVSLDHHKGNKQHARRAIRYKKWDTWGPRTKAMAEEPDLLDQGLIGPLSTKWAYDIAFFVSSYYFHPTSFGLHHHVLDPGDKLSFRRSDQEAPGRQALMHTVQCLMQSASRIGHFWGMNADDELSRLWTQYIEPVP